MGLLDEWMRANVFPGRGKCGTSLIRLNRAEKRGIPFTGHTHTHTRDEEFSFRPVWRASNVTKRGTVMAGGLKHQR